MTLPCSYKPKLKVIFMKTLLNTLLASAAVCLLSMPSATPSWAGHVSSPTSPSPIGGSCSLSQTCEYNLPPPVGSIDWSQPGCQKLYPAENGGLGVMGSISLFFEGCIPGLYCASTSALMNEFIQRLAPFYPSAQSQINCVISAHTNGSPQYTAEPYGYGQWGITIGGELGTLSR